MFSSFDRYIDATDSYDYGSLCAQRPNEIIPPVATTMNTTYHVTNTLCNACVFPAISQTINASPTGLLPQHPYRLEYGKNRDFDAG